MANETGDDDCGTCGGIGVLIQERAGGHGTVIEDSMPCPSCTVDDGDERESEDIVGMVRGSDRAPYCEPESRVSFGFDYGGES